MRFAETSEALVYSFLSYWRMTAKHGSTPRKGTESGKWSVREGWWKPPGQLGRAERVSVRPLQEDGVQTARQVSDLVGLRSLAQHLGWNLYSVLKN